MANLVHPAPSNRPTTEAPRRGFSACSFGNCAPGKWNCVDASRDCGQLRRNHVINSEIVRVGLAHEQQRKSDSNIRRSQEPRRLHKRGRNLGARSREPSNMVRLAAGWESAIRSAWPKAPLSLGLRPEGVTAPAAWGCPMNPRRSERRSGPRAFARSETENKEERCRRK